MNDFATEIHSLVPTIRACRDQIEQGRQLPAGLVDEVAATGVFRMGVPKALGGEEIDALDLMRVIETLSAADGSVGWCTLLGIGSSITAGYMNDAGAREVFANPDRPKALVPEPGGAATATPDGIRIRGHWRFASGVTHADWILLGAVMMEDGRPKMTPQGPQIVHAYVPTADVRIHDTWHVSGLCGTGSFDVSCEDVSVPERRVFSLFNPTSFRPEPLYQVPVPTQVAPAMATVAIGIARAALDELCELVAEKTASMSTVPVAERPYAQVEIARAEGALGSARSFLYDTVDDIWQTVVAGCQPSLRQRGLARVAALHATEVAARVTRTASTLGGGTSVYRTSSLQRHARDADVITHHFLQSPLAWEDAGRALTGMQPAAPVF